MTLIGFLITLKSSFMSLIERVIPLSVPLIRVMERSHFSHLKSNLASITRLIKIYLSFYTCKKQSLI